MMPPFDILFFKQAVTDENIVWRKHTLEKMLARRISREAVLEVLQKGKIIQTYEHDTPFPSILMLRFFENRPIHVVTSFEEKTMTVFVITAYEPDLTIFEPDFITKRK